MADVPQQIGRDQCADCDKSNERHSGPPRQALAAALDSLDLL